MLTNDDKTWLINTIRKELRDALTVTVKWEKRRDIKTGQPLAVPELEVKDVYLPEMWVEMLPFQEGAFRGLQEQVCLNDNRNNKQIEAISNILLQFEDSLKCLAMITDKAKEIGLPGDHEFVDGPTKIEDKT
jgi:hypothetical protein